jgi:predicted molibdopterin-dependent oxidoreductase YjgC
VIILWGSNARNAHPIFFKHLLKGVRNGAKLYVVDPRRSESAMFADLWLGIDVGTDIALANAMAREIIESDLVHEGFIANATVNFEEFKASVEDWTLDRAEAVTGVPAKVIKEFAHAYANAGTAQLCWTLGITEHHNATDNVLALINLSLLTGHIGRYGSGLVPVRGQNNVQGGGDMGALPNKLPGFQDVEDDELRGKFETAWGSSIPAKSGLHLSLQFEAMERGEVSAVYIIGENPARSEADSGRTKRLLQGLDTLIVQDIYMTETASMADVVFPATAAWSESNGTVTNSERRVQRVRAALAGPAGAKDDITILGLLAEQLGVEWTDQTAQHWWDELRSLSPIHYGMTYERLEAMDGLQWPCPDLDHPGSPFLHGRFWEQPRQGPAAPFHVVNHAGPVDELTDDFPMRLTTGRHLESYNTGAQTGIYDSPSRPDATIDISPQDASKLGVSNGGSVRITSRRGSIEAPVRIVSTQREGLAFMAFHYPELVDVNVVTIDAWDPKSGTSEFKATAVRLECV